MLTAEQRFHFDLKGWLKLENAIPAPEVAQYNALLERLERTPMEKMPQTWVPSRTPVIDELRIYGLMETDDAFLRLLDHPSYLEIAKELVLGPVRVTESYSISRRKGVGVPLHCPKTGDYALRGGRPYSMHLKVVLQLTDCGPEDGPFAIIEGSHKSLVPFPFGAIDADWQLPAHDALYAQAFKSQEEGGPKRISWRTIPGYRELCARAGDVILFSEDCWHGGQELRSDRTRRNIYIAYSPYHFANWHGIYHSEALLRRCTTEQRRLLAGPFLGNRLPGRVPRHDDGSEFFPPLPDSERAHGAWTAATAAADGGVADPLMQQVQARLQNPAALARGHGEVHLVLPGRGEWVIELAGESARIRAGTSPAASTRLEMGVGECEQILAGKADPVQLFYAGKLSVRGNLSLAMRVVDAMSS